jgi:hypothetical protein
LEETTISVDVIGMHYCHKGFTDEAIHVTGFAGAKPVTLFALSEKILR